MENNRRVPLEKRKPSPKKGLGTPEQQRRNRAQQRRLGNARNADANKERKELGRDAPLMSSLVLVRNMLKTDLFKRMALSQIIMACAVVLSILLSYAAFDRDPIVKFVAIGSDGLVFELNAVDQPIWTDEQVLGKATSAITDSFNFNYKNYRQALAKTFWTHYTRAGEVTFREALNEAGIIPFMIDSRAIVSAVPNNVGLIVSKDAIQGHAAWTIQIPITITYSTPNGENATSSVVEITLVRVKVAQKISGIGVTKFIFIK